MADDYVNESVPLGIKIPYHRNDLDGYFAQNRSTLLRYKTNLMMLLLTNKGERPFQPNVGSGIFALLFEHANMYTYEAVRNNIQDMLYSYEPRINQVKVKIDANDEKNEMHVTVGFNITGVASDETVDFYLERLR